MIQSLILNDEKSVSTIFSDTTQKRRNGEMMTPTQSYQQYLAAIVDELARLEVYIDFSDPTRNHDIILRTGNLFGFVHHFERFQDFIDPQVFEHLRVVPYIIRIEKGTNSDPVTLTGPR